MGELYNALFALMSGAITGICTKIILSRIGSIEEEMTHIRDKYRTKEDCVERSDKLEKECCSRHDRIRRDLDTDKEITTAAIKATANSVSIIRESVARHEAYEQGLKNGHAIGGG